MGSMGALLFALNSKSTMYEMVQNAYNVTLAGAFVPLVAGAYWHRANTQGALLSIILGIGTWLGASAWMPEAMVPANLLGLAASALGMLLGSLAPSLVPHRGMSIDAAIRHAQAVAQHQGGHHGQHGHKSGH